ncbi:KR domain-containing protein [Streptomyces sp. HNM0645]|uniref:KR domain-containing protein n=1 Tax=Streptomyces sp. HNM0645 TaxID=2782343 RepID=UPI0024B8687F|nr:KR domain-containing protein [Streptomyces sp. HNM0645]MDI9889197.1 KR domain-containing protein [Streptomyces sp. HNM0645]
MTWHRSGLPSRFYSTVLEDPRRTPAFDATYRCANLRRPVRFASAIAAAAADRHLVYLEVSPHPVVARSVTDSLPEVSPRPVVLPTLRRDQNEIATFRTQLAALHCAGVPVDWSVLYPDGALTERILAQLRGRGTRITVVLGDIAEPGTADRLVAAATADGLPLRGIAHAAMVLRDATITNISHSRLSDVWRPEVDGAWKLHEAVAHHALDWFAVYSSMASLLGNPGQGAYAAANAWLDGFAAWRTRQGLPTLSVNRGPWGETGAAVDFAERGYRTIPTHKGLHALNTLLIHGRTRTGVIPGDPDTWIPPAVRHSSLLSHLTQDGTPKDGAPVEGRGEGARDMRAALRSLPAGLARRGAWRPI